MECEEFGVLLRESLMGKSCMTSQVPFCYEVTTPVDKGRTVDIVYLDFCKALDMVPHNILSSFESDRFSRWTVRCIRDWLDGCIQRVVVNDSESC